MDQLIKALPAILRATRHSAEVVETAAIAAWRHAAGEPLKTQAVATELTGKTLVVAVSDPIWQQQLKSMSGQLLFKLNSILGQPLVSRLEFRVDATRVGVRGGYVKNSNDLTKVREDDSIEENKVSLELWSAASAIQDGQLRKTFLAAASASMRRIK